MLQGLEGYSMHAWGNIISYPSETSEGTARSLEHRELCEVLARILIIHLLCSEVLFFIPGTISCGTLEFLVTLVQSFLRVTETFYTCLQLGCVAKKKRGLMVDIIEIKLANYY